MKPNRAQRRKSRKKTNKLRKNTELEQKMGLFDKIPDECLTCMKPFDKKDKQMVMSWSVVVREEKGVVRLYCPDCWQKAKSFMEKLQSEDTNNRK